MQKHVHFIFMLRDLKKKLEEKYNFMFVFEELFDLINMT